MSPSIYDDCVALHGKDNLSQVMQCISNWVDNIHSKETSTDDMRSWLLLLSGSFVFFMQAGFAMVCAGAIRKQNVNNTLIKNLLDACGAGLAYLLLGYAISFGQKSSTDDTASLTTFMGNDNFFLFGDNIDPAFVFFQYAYSATAVTIVAGTLAERCKMTSYFAYSFWLTGFVYPVIVHNFWSNTGYFSPSNINTVIGHGIVDFSGSGVIHLTGGMSALYATCILGPRQGRFYDTDGTPLAKPGLDKGQSMSLQMLGTMILWFCWYGFNAGSALLLSSPNTGSIAARAVLNTTISAAAGTFSAMLTKAFIRKHYTGEFTLDIVMVMNGCLSGLVAVTGACGVIDYGGAIAIGIISGWVYIGMDSLLLAWKIDDAVAAIPVHLGNGLWGMIAVGLFANPKLLHDAYEVDMPPGLFYWKTLGSTLLPAQLVGILFIIGWTMGTMLPFFMMLNYLRLFRVNELDEIIGLDAAYDDPENIDGNKKKEKNNLLTAEELRLVAYRQRYEEKRRRKANKPVQSMTAQDLMSEYMKNVEAQRIEEEKKRKGSSHKSRGSSEKRDKKKPVGIPGGHSTDLPLPV